MLMHGWRHLRRSEACLVCGRGGEARNRNTHCIVTNDGAVVTCFKSGGAPFGGVAPFKVGKTGGYHYRVKEANPDSSPTFVRSTPVKRRRVNFDSLFRIWWGAVDRSVLEAHASELGLSADSLIRAGIGWAAADRDDKTGRTILAATQSLAEPTFCLLPGAWVFPLRDEKGEIVGARIRTGRGKKYTVNQSDGSGIIIPSSLASGGVLALPEGPTNLAALLTMGIDAAGRPNNSAGVSAVAGLVRRLRTRRVVLIGDNDNRFNPHLGRWQWPGKEGAELTAAQLQRQGVRADILFPPRDFKDVRDWLKSGVKLGEAQQWICVDGRAVA